MFKMYMNLDENKNLSNRQINIALQKIADFYNTHSAEVMNGLISDIKGSSKAEIENNEVVITLDYLGAYLSEEEVEIVETNLLEQFISFLDSPLVDTSVEPETEFAIEEIEHKFVEIEELDE